MLRQKIPAGCDGDVSGERFAREVIAVFHLKIADLDGQIASADGDGTGNDLPDAPLHTGVVIGKFRLRGDPYACSQVDGPGRKIVCCRCLRPCDLISLAVPEQPLDLILLYDLIQAGQMLRQKIPAGCDGDVSGERVS